MHDLPDTEEADAAAERYWPDHFKGVLRTALQERVEGPFLRERAFEELYRRLYAASFSDYASFCRRLAEGVVIGAENGVDETLEAIRRTLSRKKALPEKRPLAVYFWPDPFDADLTRILQREVFEEWGTHPIFRHLYEDHYTGPLSFDDFVAALAETAVSGARNGADGMLGEIYRAFLFERPLPSFRRRPRLVR
jgi:hypothetical protein